jgi:hypothetical protein
VAIAFVNSAIAVWTSGSTITLPSQSHTAGNLILVAVGTDNNLNVNSVSDTAGNVYVQAYVGVRQTTGNNWASFWYAKNITGNAGNVVVVHLSGTPGTGRVAALQYSGCDLIGPIDATPVGTHTTSNNPNLPSFTPANASETIVFCADCGSSQTWTPDANYTNRAYGSGNAFIALDRVGAPGAAQNCSNTTSGSPAWASAGVGLIAAAGGGGGDPNLPTIPAAFPVLASTDQGPGGSSFTLDSGSYDVPANSILLAFSSVDWGNSGMTLTNTSIATGTITWTRVQYDSSQGTIGSVAAWKGVVSAAGATGVNSRVTFTQGNNAHLYVCAFQNCQTSDIGSSSLALGTGSSAPTCVIDPRGNNSSLLVGFGWNPGSGGARSLLLGQWADNTDLHVWLQTYNCTSGAPQTMGLSTPSYSKWAMIDAEVLASTSVNVWPQQYAGSGRYPVERSRRLNGRIEVMPPKIILPVVVPTQTRWFIGPDRVVRFPWNPPRGEARGSPFPFVPYDPSGSKGMPWGPVLPQRFIRPVWSPQRFVKYMPLGIIARNGVTAPTDAYVNCPFTCYVTINNTTSTDNLLVIDVQPVFVGANERYMAGTFSPVNVPGRSGLPTRLSAAYSASGWLKVTGGGSQTYSFNCVIFQPGVFAIGANITTAIANDMGTMRSTIRNPSTRAAEYALVTVHQIG